MPHTFLAWSWWMSWWVVRKVDWCLVSAWTVGFIFRLCYSVIRVGLIGALWRWYRFLLYFISCVFLLSSWQEYCRICTLSLQNSCREACCEDVAVIRKLSPFSLFSSWYFACREACCEDIAVIRQISPFSLFLSWYFVERWSVHQCRGYRPFFFHFPVKFVSTIETY